MPCGLLANKSSQNGFTLWILEWVLVWYYGGWRTPENDELRRIAANAEHARQTRERRKRQKEGDLGISAQDNHMVSPATRAIMSLSPLQQAGGNRQPEKLGVSFAPQPPAYSVTVPRWADGTERPLEKTDYGYFPMEVCRWKWTGEVWWALVPSCCANTCCSS